MLLLLVLGLILPPKPLHNKLPVLELAFKLKEGLFSQTVFPLSTVIVGAAIKLILTSSNTALQPPLLLEVKRRRIGVPAFNSAADAL